MECLKGWTEQMDRQDEVFNEMLKQHFDECRRLKTSMEFLMSSFSNRQNSQLFQAVRAVFVKISTEKKRYISSE
jgi:hypothetical protein